MRLNLKRTFVYFNCILIFLSIFFIGTGSIFYFYGDSVTALGVKPPFYVPLSDRVSGIGGRMFRA